MSDLTIYTVAWICAIGTELVAAKQFLDETHDAADQLPANDDNAYVLGKVGRHNIVITALPHGQYGLVSAAIVARDMARSFPNLRFALMVGIGGGAPSRRHDIRLGDIVVSSPDSGIGGVLQYDFGKTIQDESFKVTGHLNQSPQCLLRAIPLLEADYESDGNGIDTTIAGILETKPRLRAKYRKPESSIDRLFTPVYKHAGDKDQECTAMCDATHLVERPERSDEEDSPTIHYGTIASANQLMKDANLRDKLSAEHDVLCFEMEAAGLMNQFPCIVIRGICDYSDTHKNKIWQGYAAMAAAAYAKDLLRKVAPNKIEAERRLVDVLSDVNSKLEIIDSQVKTTQTDVKSIRMDKHSDDIMQWLAPPDVSSNFNKAIKARHPGSGRKLLESKAYTTWKTGDSSFLWLHGIPGCGKTILASTVIEDLKKSQNHAQLLLYFYFDFTDNRKQSFENTLRSLVWQIYHQNEDARKHLDSLYSSTYQNGKVQPSFASLQKAFTEMIGNLGGVWIVLDALDECTPRGELLAWLRSVNQDLSVQVKMHLLVTSRPEQDIESAIKRYASDEQIVAIRDDLLKADIRNYVQARVRKGEGLSRWRGQEEIQDSIEASLLEKANGMFRWVSCQLDALEDCLERKALLKALQSLPQTLDETYERILANIPSAHIHHTRRILQFLTYSERPLRLDEAVDAIAIDVGQDVARGRRFDPKDRLPVPEEITRYCSTLVILVSRQHGYNKEQEVIEIQLAHFSVKDYLLSDRLPGSIAWFLQATVARSLIAEVCLTYLFELKQTYDINWIKEEFPFLQYSAQFWISHAGVGERSSESVLKLAKRALVNRSLLEILCRFCDLDYARYGKKSFGVFIAPALYYASIQGLPRCAQLLLDEGADVNAQGGHYGNALQAASYKGQREIVQVLLDNGADINAQGGHYGNALQAASAGGHQRIVQLLLDNGADINAKGGEHGNTLQAASYEGQREIVQVLLDNGADINAQGGEYGNALQTALYRGHQEIVQILVNNKADVNAQSGKHGDALQAASLRGHQEIVKLLLNNGANINSQGGEYGNALQAASSGGHQEIVKLLLNNGANINSQGGEYGNALQAASSGGHQEIVKLLLDNGADVNARNRSYGSALHIASEDGYQGIVQLLLDNGADVNAHGGYYSNALQAASSRGHQEIVKLLLDNGSDVNARNRSYGSALYVASENGYQGIVQLLLDNGADVNAIGGKYGNALQAASSGGHKLQFNNGVNVNAQNRSYGNALYVASEDGYQGVIQLLLDNGANVNATGGKYGNALQAASSQGQQETVKLLLDNGADVNARNRSYGSALYVASEDGYQGIVQLLLDNGADVNAIGGKYGNALQAASLGGHQEIVKLLLNNGANINAQGGEYGNALQAASSGGHQEIVKLLLDNGADVNAQNRSYGSALYVASEDGYQGIVQLLLDNGADVNAIGGKYGNALQAALYRGHQKIIKLLLDNGVNVNAQNRSYGNALYVASEQGYQENVKLLLENGADVNAQGGYYGNALQAASHKGSQGIVQLLLDNGADVNAKGGEHGNALYAASCRGQQEIVQILVDNKADVNAQGGFYGNALQAASASGHREIVQLLNAARKADDDINLQRSMPLFFAVNGEQKPSSLEIQRQSNKRKRIESRQESITKKPCI